MRGSCGQEPSLVWNPGERAEHFAIRFLLTWSLQEAHVCPGLGAVGEVRVTHEQLDIPSYSVSSSEMVSRPQKVPSLEESTPSHRLPHHPLTYPCPTKSSTQLPKCKPLGFHGGRHVRTPEKTHCSLVRGQKRARSSQGQHDGRRDPGAARYNYPQP